MARTATTNTTQNQIRITFGGRARALHNTHITAVMTAGIANRVASMSTQASYQRKEAL